MSKELEDRISELVDERMAGVAPVTVEEVVDERSTTAGRSAAGTDRKRWLVPAIAAAAALVVGAVAGLVVLGGDDAPAEVVVGGPVDEEPAGTDGPDAGEDRSATENGWTTFVEPSFGWTWEQPTGWTSQSEHDYCGGMGFTGTFVTNTSQRYSHPVSGSSCSTNWALPNPLAERFVGVNVVSMEETFAELGDFPDQPTAFPLGLEDLQPFEDDLYNAMFPGAVAPTRSIVINSEGRRFVLSTFEGAGMSDEDRTALARLVESIDPTGLPPADPIRLGYLPEGAELGMVHPEAPADPTYVVYELRPEGDRRRTVQVSTTTNFTELEQHRAELALDRPRVVEDRAVPVGRQRIEVRGVRAVHDRAVTPDGDEVSAVRFFDYDNLHVVVTAHNVADDELYRIIEGLQLVAVGGPNG